MTIQEDIQKIIKGIKIEEFQKKVLKKRSWFRGDTNIDPVPDYWENLINQLNSPSARETVEEIKELGNQVVEYDEKIDQILELLGYKEEFPDFEGVANVANLNDKTYWTKLAEKFSHSTRDNVKFLNSREGVLSKHFGF